MSTQVACAQGQSSPSAYSVPAGVEYYSGGAFTQQIAQNGGYSTNYAYPTETMLQNEMVPLQVQQMQTAMVQEPVAEMFPVQQVQQVVGMVPVPLQVYIPAPTPTRSPPLKERRTPDKPREKERDYERAAPSPEPEPEIEPEIIERFTIRERVIPVRLKPKIQSLLSHIRNCPTGGPYYSGPGRKNQV
jgi:hypothetical protein